MWDFSRHISIIRREGGPFRGATTPKGMARIDRAPGGPKHCTLSDRRSSSASPVAAL